MDKISELIEVKDLWIKNSKYFNKATFYSDKIMEINYPNVFKDYERTEKLYMIKFLGNILLSEISLQNCELEHIKLKNEFYNFHLDSKDFINNENLSSDLRKIYYFYSLFKNISKNFKNINIEKYKMKVIYGIEPNIFQVLSSLYLEEFEDIQIMLNINNNGKLSLRCNQNIKDINLNDISNKYFSGGGHAKAAGGKINLTEKFYSQNSMEKLISDLIKEKQSIEQEFSL
jgi:oligoribonuclease NrnB/cAMP/cGMP phosphodiesterase (DHH superfamily)